MLKTYTYPEFAYRQSEEQRLGVVKRHPVVIVGAGPIGLTAALECASRGIPAVLLDDNNTVSVGSRAVCYAKRPLEIWDRLGVGEAMARKGVSWNVGKVFFHDDLVYQFDLLPEEGHKMPAMINLQQYYLEEFLVEACDKSGLVDLRWKHKLISLSQEADHARLTLETPDGVFQLEADWVIACDGANSDTRKMLGAEFTGQFFQDRFLIADVVMKADFPTERWFWFDPPFHRGQSVLLHRQCDNVWRIDFQLGWDADPERREEARERDPAHPGHARQGRGVRAGVGLRLPVRLPPHRPASAMAACCSPATRRTRSRPSAPVAPTPASRTWTTWSGSSSWCSMGARPKHCSTRYHEERAFAADDNLLNSTRSTDFITPKSRASRVLRDAVLQLAQEQPFARKLVNSGRLSTPTPYLQSSLNTPDEDSFAGTMRPGTNCADAPVKRRGEQLWLLNQLPAGFSLLVFAPDAPVSEVRVGDVAAEVVCVGRDFSDAEGLLAQRYDAQPGTVYLLRPDRHVAARWRSFDPAHIRAALARACSLKESA